MNRRVCRESHLPRSEWPAGAVALLAPTLLLDLMLCRAAGALLGVTVGHTSER